MGHGDQIQLFAIVHITAHRKCRQPDRGQSYKPKGEPRLPDRGSIAAPLPPESEDFECVLIPSTSLKSRPFAEAAGTLAAKQEGRRQNDGGKMVKSAKRGKSVLSERFLASPADFAKKNFTGSRRTKLAADRSLRMSLARRVGAVEAMMIDGMFARSNASRRVRHDCAARRCMTLAAVHVRRRHFRLHHTIHSSAKRSHS